MAVSVADVLQLVCSENLIGLKLKKEQEQAVLALLEKKDVFAILPTGYFFFFNLKMHVYNLLPFPLHDVLDHARSNTAMRCSNG